MERPVDNLTEITKRMLAAAGPAADSVNVNVGPRIEVESDTVIATLGVGDALAFDLGVDMNGNLRVQPGSMTVERAK